MPKITKLKKAFAKARVKNIFLLCRLNTSLSDAQAQIDDLKAERDCLKDRVIELETQLEKEIES